MVAFAMTKIGEIKIGSNRKKASDGASGRDDSATATTDVASEEEMKRATVEIKLRQSKGRRKGREEKKTQIRSMWSHFALRVR